MTVLSLAETYLIEELSLMQSLAVGLNNFLDEVVCGLINQPFILVSHISWILLSFVFFFNLFYSSLLCLLLNSL